MIRQISREEAWKWVLAERRDQDSIWGGEGHDSNHSIGDWAHILSNQSGKANIEALNGCNIYAARDRWTKIAAVALAAIESCNEHSNTKDKGQ